MTTEREGSDTAEESVTVRRERAAFVAPRHPVPTSPTSAIFVAQQQLAHIIRAWKDEDYRNRLSEDERRRLPENPAGLIDLTDDEMALILRQEPIEVVGAGDTADCGILGISTAYKCLDWETVGCTGFQPGCD